ncbi:MAG: hypothetical protein K0U13_06045, partial [Chlamydiae bacterium]|nr:hypothetical protein [Chlamydiota bacterium]
MPSSGAEVDLSPFDLNLGGVDLSAQPSASQPAGGLDFQQLQPSAATNLPQDHRYASLAVGNQGPTSAFPPGFFDDLLVEVGQPAEPLVGTTVDQRGGELDLNFDQPSAQLGQGARPSASQPAFLGHGGFDFDADLQQHQLQGTTTWLQDAQVWQGFADMAVGNHGPPAAFLSDFLDDFPVVAQGAAPAAVGQPAEPLVGVPVGQQEEALDLNFDQPSASQPAFLGHGGFDFDADLQQHQLQGTTTWLQDA